VTVTATSGVCPGGWNSCAVTVGGGCCPTGYSCGISDCPVSSTTDDGVVIVATGSAVPKTIIVSPNGSARRVKMDWTIVLIASGLCGYLIMVGFL